jgi:tetracycline resistance efflux pump
MNFGFWSVVPPIITIVLAIITKSVFLALFIGVFLSYLVITSWQFFPALDMTLNGFINVFASTGNTIVILSMLMIGALIYMIEKSGGITGFVDVMVKRRGLIKSKRAANLFNWLLGVLVFTSGSLSCMVVGSVSRPINDALKVSHEKAAYITHTTSTPVCVLIPLSGWLAAMLGYLQSGGVPESEATGILIKSIPLNFYSMIAVFGTLILILAKKDFGPMKQAELRADTGLLDAKPKDSKAVNLDELEDIKPNSLNLFIPLLTLIVTILVALTVTGNGNPLQGAGMGSLLWGCFVSLLVMGAMMVFQKRATLNQVIEEAFVGASGMLNIAAVLMFAFAMGTVVKELGTGFYLSDVFSRFLSPALLPALVFIMGMLISFATGTSMGTMAILSVIALPMAYTMGVDIALVASAIWGGCIFGDHASPISDTTIMSCSTTGCDIIDHIKTQLPYVMSFAGLSLVLYVIAGFIL